MVFHWSVSDNKSPQVSRTLLSILAVLNNAVFWMVSTRLQTSKSSSRFNNPLVTIPKAPITIGKIIIIIPWFNPWSSHTKDSKMILDTSLLNTQHYKVGIKGK